MQANLTWWLIVKELTWSLSLPWVMLLFNYGNDGPVLELCHSDLLCSKPSLLKPNAHYSLFISHLQSNDNTAFPRQWKRRGSLLSTQTLRRSLPPCSLCEESVWKDSPLLSGLWSDSIYSSLANNVHIFGNDHFKSTTLNLCILTSDDTPITWRIDCEIDFSIKVNKE